MRPSHPHRPDPHGKAVRSGVDRTLALLLKGYAWLRCPGEDIAVAVLAAAAPVLARLDFTVPEQDLRIPLHRIPTRPRDGLRIVVGAGAGAASRSVAGGGRP
ncbi:hypothetical protein AB0M64_07095 [Streptomyces sp. NPDC051771]|uniref:hypothetical protein n=1 Tax=Streptomyces sp. NPDC051771 TaxID=3154847 RepID=UPI003427D8FB